MLRVLPIILLLLSLALYVSVSAGVWENRAEVRASVPAGYIIPSKFSRIMSLGHQGLLSDFLFLKTATFIGGRSISDEVLNDDDWNFVITSLDTITDLDPYFADPYVMAEGLLVWEAGRPEDANRLLKKGMAYRTEDWRLPFYVGFNYFYVLKQHDVAADYIMQAARLPGSPSYLPRLAGRLAYYGGKSKTALLFLSEMLAETDDAVLKSRLEMRLLALERAVMIEEALEKFKNEFGRGPGKNELVAKGFLAEMPVDPYGGEWIVLENGRVFSTSKFTTMPSRKTTAEDSNPQSSNDNREQ